MYYVYENWQAGLHKAVVHIDSCGHCKNGRGKMGHYDRKHASWHGPFDSLQSADAFAEGIQGGVIVQKHCTCV
jgi:sulfur relay (sulfurtransferase) complex TusBCD TusD component (DsrE family)